MMLRQGLTGLFILGVAAAAAVTAWAWSRLTEINLTGPVVLGLLILLISSVTLYLELDRAEDTRGMVRTFSLFSTQILFFVVTFCTGTWLLLRFNLAFIFPWLPDWLVTPIFGIEFGVYAISYLKCLRWMIDRGMFGRYY